MPQYHVVRDGDRWKVTVNGRTVKTANTKAPAVSDAKDLARRNGGDVVVHRRNGVIQERVTPR